MKETEIKVTPELLESSGWEKIDHRNGFIELRLCTNYEEGGKKHRKKQSVTFFYSSILRLDGFEVKLYNGGHVKYQALIYGDYSVDMLCAALRACFMHDLADKLESRTLCSQK